jgi:hypothetical protein
MALLPTAALILSACYGSPTEPTFSQLDDALELRVGVAVHVGTEGLLLAFRAVPRDSRCPADAVCVWEGDATVRLEAKLPDGAWSRIDLHTALEPRVAEFGPYAIELLGLLPQPHSTRPVRDRDYRASVRVRRR